MPIKDKHSPRSQLQPRGYVEGQNRKVDELVSTYEHLEGIQAFAEAAPERERTPKDPFGLSEAPGDPLEGAKECTDRMLKFGALLAEEYQLDPTSVVFMHELVALNVFNTDNCPLTATQIEEARRRAYDYYVAGRKLLDKAR